MADGMLIVLCLGGTQAPEIQQMYSLNMPVSRIRTKVRSEFEKHRYVNQLDVVDVLLFQSHSEFQVSGLSPIPRETVVRRERQRVGWVLGKYETLLTKQYVVSL